MSNSKTILFNTIGTGSYTKPFGITKIIAECWGPGGGGESNFTSNIRGAGGAGGQYARSTLIYPIAETTIPYIVGPEQPSLGIPGGAPYLQTEWDNGIVIAKGGGNAWSIQGGNGSTDGGVGDIVYSGGNGNSAAQYSLGLFGHGGGGAGSTGNGNAATAGAPGAAKSEYGGAGGECPLFANANGVTGSVYGGGGSGATRGSGTGTFTGGPGAQGLVRITIINEQNISSIGWNGNTLLMGYALDNSTSYSTVIDGSDFVRTENGTEYSWVPNTNYILEADIRWIPTTSTATQTGWDGATGWRAFLEYARAKNKFTFYPFTGISTGIESYLVDPLDGQHELEPDGTRRIRLVIRNTTTPYTGF